MPENLRFDETAGYARVVFGAGRMRELPGELDALGAHRVLLVTSRGRLDEAVWMRPLLADRLTGILDRAREHVPAALVPKAVAAARTAGADACVTFGGGSAIGLGKAIARETGLPLAAVPTTYSGSEMTAVWGTSAGGVKTTGRDPRVRPRLVLYDPELTYALPSIVSAASGMNAIAHCVEALWAPDASAASTALAEDGLRLLARSLPHVVRSPADVVARGEALAGAYRAGRALDLTTMGLHHRICHVLGGLGLPHAATHAALLPHVVAFKAASAPDAITRIAAALGTPDGVEGIRVLARTLGTKPLASLGFHKEGVPQAARAASAGSPLATEAEIRGILEHALADT